MAGVVKPTSFQTGGTTPVAVKDVYREDTLKAANAFKSETGSAAEQAGDYLSGVGKSLSGKTTALLKSISSAIGSDADGLTLDGDALKKRIGNIAGVPTSLNDITDVDKNKIISALSDITNTNSLKVVYNGAETVFNGDFDSVSGIVNVVKDLVDDTDLVELFDISAETAVMSVIIGSLVSWGAVSLIDKLLDSIEDSKVKNAALESAAKAAANTGDAEKVLHYVKKMGSSRTTAIKEALIGPLLINYKHSDDETRSYTVLGEKLIEVLTAIDKNWNMDEKNANVVSLRYYIEANKIAKAVFYQTAHRKYAQAATVTEKAGIDTINSAAFPEVIDWK